MKVDIDLERLRRLAMTANAESAATHFAHDEMKESGRAFRAAKVALDSWVSNYGGIPHQLSEEEKTGQVGGEKAPNTRLLQRRIAVGNYNILVADFESAKTRHEHAEAEFERRRGVSSLSQRLAQSGLDFAKNQMAVPASIMELFA